jgi:hypothetical protein
MNIMRLTAQDDPAGSSPLASETEEQNVMRGFVVVSSVVIVRT